MNKAIFLRIILLLSLPKVSYASFLDDTVKSVGITLKGTVKEVTRELDEKLKHSIVNMSKDEIDLLHCGKILGRQQLNIDRLSSIMSNALESNDYDQAICYADRLLTIAKTSGDKEQETVCLVVLATAYHHKGEHHELVMHYSTEGLRAVEDLKENKEMQSLSKMMLLGLLAFVDMQLSSPSNAIDKLNECLIIARDSDEINQALYYNQIAPAYMMLGRYSEAINSINRSLKINRKSLFKMSYQYLGKAYWGIGEYSLALKYHEKAFEYEEDKHELSALHNLSIAHLLDGNRKKAKALFKGDMGDLSSSVFYLLNDEPNNAIAIANKYINRKDIAFSLGALSGVYTVLGLSYEKINDISHSIEYFTKAAEIEERQRESLFMRDRLHFLEGMSEPPFKRQVVYEGLIRVSNEEDAFYYSEALKARTLIDQMGSAYENPDFDVPVMIRHKENEIVNSIALLIKERKMAAENKFITTVNKIEKEIVLLRKELVSFTDRIYLEYPEYSTIKYPRPLKLAEIKLNSDEVLIEYAITESKTLAWLIKKGQILKTISLDISRKELEKLIAKYLEQISDPEMLKRQDFDVELGNKLYTLLIKDFMPMINSNHNIIIIPDKILGLLPFETLIVGIPEKIEILRGKYGYYPSGLKYLGDDYNISYYQSASALTMTRTFVKRQNRDNSLFIVSDPIYNSDDPRLSIDDRVVKEKNESELKKDVESHTRLPLHRLEGTGFLARNLLKLFKGLKTEHLTGLEANELNLRKMMISEYQYLVFATHGLLDNKINGFIEPALVLSQVKNYEQDDGFLTMGEVMGYKLKSDVVALTACVTGSGDMVSGEGIMSLARAFQYAGAKSVLASLWWVSEDSTIKLVEKFFFNIKNGKSKSTAIRMARNDIRKDGYEHPFFWAPFILIGEN